MADFNRCISALNHAAGRQLSADELEQVMARIHQTALDLKAGRLKPAGGPHNLSTPEGLMRQAAELSAAQLIAEADRKAHNAILDAQTAATRTAEVGAMRGAGLTDVESVRRLLVNMPDGKADQFSLETRAKGISQFLRSKIQDTWQAIDRNFVEYLQSKDKVKVLLRELRGEDTGDAIAKKGAAAWLKMAEEARQWFNDKGGQIGRLEDWALPQHHSQDLVSRAGGGSDVAANRAAWVEFVMPRLARDRYTDLAGRQMSDGEIAAFLGKAWDTIASSGATKIEPGKFKGNGGRGNRHSEERQIHFKDADATLEYWERFGEKTMPDVMLGHVETMAKDIAFLEHFGSNPDGMYRLLRDQAEKTAKLADPTKIDKVDGELARLDNLYDYAAGRSKPVANRSVAKTFDVLKNLNVAGKLGSAFWASLIGDKVMFEAIGHVNNLPAFQRWHNEIRLLNPANRAERRQLRRHALMLDYMTQAMSRFGEELGSSSFTGKLANGVMKVTGMGAVNEWRRGAWALTAMDTIGHLTKTREWGSIGSQDMRLLKSYGIDEQDWAVWKLAKLDDLGHGNDTALTPESISRITDDELRAANLISQAGGPEEGAARRRDATIKFLGALTAESHVAVIEPGWKQRTTMYGGLQRGDVRDELTRSFWQFKAFPLTQFELMLDVGMSRPTTGGKAAFLSMVPVMSTIAGAMMLQVQEMLAGKDPRPMNDWKFWAAAFLKGGSLGLYGDFLFSGSGETRAGSGPLEAIAGPTIGAAADMATFLAKAPGKAAKGEDSELAARALGILKGFVPGQNLWMTKAATDHLIFQSAQEALNPGYLASMRARSLKERGNDWWWAPGEPLPSRPPNLENAGAGR